MQQESHYQQQSDLWQSYFDDWLVGELMRTDNGIVNRIFVIGECVSTQDVCMEVVEESGKAGACCVAVHQTGGRGRLGRKWFDARGECASFTLAIEFDGCAERLAVRCGIATCLAAERMMNEMGCGHASWVKIRWPNDVMVDGKKLAGVLVEVRDNIAFVGIGMNVSQQDWPDELSDIAISLYEICTSNTPVRPLVVSRIVEALHDVFKMSDLQLGQSFSSHDCLVGQRCLFTVRNVQFSGEVLSLDPLRGLMVRMEEEVTGLECGEDGYVFLPAGITSLVKVVD